MPRRTVAERIKGMHVLANALDEQRKKTKETCIAAAKEMTNAWVAGRNFDRRVSTKPHPGPERRRR